MPIRVKCPNPQCGRLLDCPEQSAGKKVSCSICGTALQVPAGASAAGGPQRLGDYQILRKLGEGGMGAVYEALQTKLDRKVALKVLPRKFTSDPNYLERFQREAKAAAALNHPNIIQVYDIGEDGENHFFAMEFVDGESVQARLKRQGKIPLPEALDIIDAVARALQCAHERAIIHRDIKPDNILLTRSDQVKLADLGLAKSTKDDTHVTQTGAGLGTPYYMAPEQAEDARSVDHRADIYALGITFLHLLTGRLPFTGDSAFGIIIAHQKKPLPSAKELGTDIPAEVESVIRKMAAKAPEDRYTDYLSLLADLEALMGSDGRSATSSRTLRLAPTVAAVRRDPEKRRSRITLYASMGAAAVVLLAIGAFLATRARREPAPQPRPASAPKIPVISVTSSPTGADVVIRKKADGRWNKAFGDSMKTPVRKEAARNTDYQVELALDDFQPVTREVKVLEDGEYEVAVELMKWQLPASMALAFEVPEEMEDKYGNPIRKGWVKASGLPLEIRHRMTRMHLVFIPAGEFRMGSPDMESGRGPSEGPVHQVILTKPFYLGKYEVTQDEWVMVTGGNPSFLKSGRHPVEQTSWAFCQEFVRTLNRQIRPAAASGAGQPANPGTQAGDEGGPRPSFALPTEAQWEYACRAGTETRFAHGDDPDGRQLRDYAWFRGNSGNKPHPVGERKPNAWGLYDMHGNAWEWCQDWNAAYDAGIATDPEVTGAGTHRVHRGGCVGDGPSECRSAYRAGNPPHHRAGVLGCRVVLRMDP